MRTFLRLSVFECRQSLKKPLLWITAIILINMHAYLFTDFPMTDYEEFVHQIELRKEGNGASNYAMEMYSPLTEEEAYAGTMQKYCTFCSINYKLDYDQIYRYVMDNTCTIWCRKRESHTLFRSIRNPATSFLLAYVAVIMKDGPPIGTVCSPNGIIQSISANDTGIWQVSVCCSMPSRFLPPRFRRK